MLSFKLTENNAGIMLISDLLSLDLLGELIDMASCENHYFSSSSCFDYNVRQEISTLFQFIPSPQKAPKKSKKSGPEYQIKILWPVFLMMVMALRQSMAFMLANKRYYSMVSELEIIMKQSLFEAIPTQADEIIARVNNAIGPSFHPINEIMNNRCYYFINLPEKERLTMLSSLMHTFHPMYNMIYKHSDEDRSLFIDPSVFDTNISPYDELPDFFW